MFLPFIILKITASVFSPICAILTILHRFIPPPWKSSAAHECGDENVPKYVVCLGLLSLIFMVRSRPIRILDCCWLNWPHEIKWGNGQLWRNLGEPSKHRQSCNQIAITAGPPFRRRLPLVWCNNYGKVTVTRGNSQGYMSEQYTMFSVRHR